MKIVIRYIVTERPIFGAVEYTEIPFDHVVNSKNILSAIAAWDKANEGRRRRISFKLKTGFVWD